MTEQELADLLGRAGIRPAWQGTREARPGYQQQQSPAGALADPRTVPYRRVPTRRDREFSRAALADTVQRGAYAEPRNQFAEAGMNALETTGAPSFARGVRSIQANEPGRAAGEFAMGGLGLLGTATLPFGSGARPAPPRVPPGEWETAYRGMMQPFDGEFRSYPEGWYGDTLSVARTPESASFYARRDTGSTFGEGANVMPLEVRGPFLPQSTQEEIVRRQMRHTNPGRRVWLNQHTRPIVERVNRELRRRGYTGVETDIDNEIALFPDEGGGFSNIRSRFEAPPPRIPRIQQAPPRYTPYQEELRAQGFNVDRPMYHGTASEFDDFRPDREIWMSPNPEVANEYARRGEEIYQRGNPYVRPLYARNTQEAGDHAFVRSPDDVRPMFGQPEAQGIPNAPPRLPGRATDGSVLPVRPREPIRQSLVGGSDDLMEATQLRAPEVRKLDFPEDERQGLRSYESQNTSVSIERLPGDSSASVGWSLRGQRPASLQARARLEQEGINAAIEALRQDAAANPGATYHFMGGNRSLIRRYRRLAESQAEAAGFEVREIDGSLALVPRTPPPPMFPGGRNR